MTPLRWRKAGEGMWVATCPETGRQYQVSSWRSRHGLPGQRYYLVTYHAHVRDVDGELRRIVRVGSQRAITGYRAHVRAVEEYRRGDPRFAAVRDDR